MLKVGPKKGESRPCIGQGGVNERSMNGHRRINAGSNTGQRRAKEGPNKGQCRVPKRDTEGPKSKGGQGRADGRLMQGSAWSMNGKGRSWDGL